MRTHTHPQDTSEMRTHTHPQDKSEMRTHTHPQDTSEMRTHMHPRYTREISVSSYIGTWNSHVDTLPLLVFSGTVSLSVNSIGSYLLPIAKSHR